MERTFALLDQMKREGLFKAYAVGGGIAAMYYLEPILTYDLDIFFIPSKEGIDLLSPLYAYLKEKGYPSEKEHVVIEGIPVQLIPVYNGLIEEAVKNARESEYKGVKIPILTAEYLIAISLQTYRPKDRERLVKFLEEARINGLELGKILKSHGLEEKFGKFKERYREG
jgi:hypothetical protein